MIYEWRCMQCKDITNVMSNVDNRTLMPSAARQQHEDHCTNTEVVRILSVPNPDFEHMRDKGILERIEKW